MKNDLGDPKRIDSLYVRVSSHIDQARQSIQKTIDTEMVRAYWLIGRDILKEEQKGKKRAEYGSYIIKELSRRLSKQYSKGFGISTLKDMRQFYLPKFPKKLGTRSPLLQDLSKIIPY